MTTESELRRENLELREEKDILLLRQENRELKREIERLKKGKIMPRSKHSELSWSLRIINACMIICIALTIFYVIAKQFVVL